MSKNKKAKKLFVERGMHFATNQDKELKKQVKPKKGTQVFYVATKKDSNKPNRGMTIAVEQTEMGDVAVGFSFCRKTDLFNKFEGRSRAINRARLYADGDESRKAVLVPKSGNIALDVSNALRKIDKGKIPNRYWKIIRKGFKINGTKISVER